MGWGERSLGGVHIYRIDFPHRMLRDPYVHELASRLLECLSRTTPESVERLRVGPLGSGHQPSPIDIEAMSHVLVNATTDSRFDLGVHEVHVWHAELTNAEDARNLEPLLSPDENERAARFQVSQNTAAVSGSPVDFCVNCSLPT